MTTILLTRSRQFLPLTGYLSGFGIPVERYIERFHLPGKMLDAPDMFIDEARFWRLAGDLAQREGFLDWGLRAGKKLDLSVLGEFGTLLLQQPSLKAALETFVVAIRAESLQFDFGLMRQGEHFWLFIRGHRGGSAGRSIIELYELQFLFILVQSAAGTNWRPPAIHLQSDSLPEGLSRAELTTGNIRLSSTMTAIAIPEAMLAAPMSGYRSFPAAGTGNGQGNLAEPDFPTSLRLLLTGYLDEGPTINDCADLVGISERTLQRRLAEYDTSFNQLLDQTRFDNAKQLLQDKSISVSDVCYELGYANPANFTRAFRRWAGVSPRQHRQLHCQSQ